MKSHKFRSSIGLGSGYITAFLIITHICIHIVQFMRNSHLVN